MLTLLRRLGIGRRQRELTAVFAPSYLRLSAAAFSGLVYLLDWRDIAIYIPWYNKKFPDEPPEELL